MAKIEYVKEIDDLIRIEYVFATTTFKEGLVTNKKNDGTIIEDLPENGILGKLFEVNPHAKVISTGGTAGLIKDAGYNVIEVSDYTGWPEMKTGLVKSMDPKLYVGMLAHPYTKSDAEFMKKMDFSSIDMVLVNFYPLEQAIENNQLIGNPQAFEIVRQNIDVGGPTAVHTSDKGFLTTAVATRPEDYVRFTEDLKIYHGCISLTSRVIGMQHCTEDLARYHRAIANFMNSVTPRDIKNAYAVIHNPVND